MSHTLTSNEIKILPAAASTAAKFLNFSHRQGSQRFYDGTTHSGLVVELPGWRYPVVVKDDGSVVYDNFNGFWGDIRELRKLTAYTLVDMAHENLSLVSMTEDTQTGELIFQTV